MVYQVMLLSLFFVKQEMVKKTLKKTLHHCACSWINTIRCQDICSQKDDQVWILYIQENNFWRVAHNYNSQNLISTRQLFADIAQQFPGRQTLVPTCKLPCLQLIALLTPTNLVLPHGPKHHFQTDKTRNSWPFTCETVIKNDKIYVHFLLLLNVEISCFWVDANKVFEDDQSNCVNSLRAWLTELINQTWCCGIFIPLSKCIIK